MLFCCRMVPLCLKATQLYHSELFSDKNKISIEQQFFSCARLAENQSTIATQMKYSQSSEQPILILHPSCCTTPLVEYTSYQPQRKIIKFELAALTLIIYTPRLITYTSVAWVDLRAQLSWMLSRSQWWKSVLTQSSRERVNNRIQRP